MTITALRPSPTVEACSRPAGATDDPSRRQHVVLAPLRNGRTIHFIDIENLAGGHFTREWLLTVWMAYEQLIVPGDIVIVAASGYVASLVFFDLPAWVVKKVVRGGKNAADNALLGEFDASFLANRFEWLQIASNDGVFASMVDTAHAHHMKVAWVGGIGAGTRVRHAADLHSQLRLPGAGSLALAA
jgi:hypothetical protein